MRFCSCCLDTPVLDQLGAGDTDVPMNGDIGVDGQPEEEGNISYFNK